MRFRNFALIVALSVSLCAQSGARKTLDIYVIDVEGGNATLVVSPQRESLLIDTGNTGAAAARDAGRIIAAAKDAGLQQIDHLSPHIGTAIISGEWRSWRSEFRSVNSSIMAPTLSRPLPPILF